MFATVRADLTDEAVFFVRDFDGNPLYPEPRAFEGSAAGRRLK